MRGGARRQGVGGGQLSWGRSARRARGCILSIAGLDSAYGAGSTHAPRTRPLACSPTGGGEQGVRP